MLHGGGEDIDFDFDLMLSHKNVFEKEWGAIVGNLRAEDSEGKDITSDITFTIDSNDAVASKFEIVNQEVLDCDIGFDGAGACVGDDVGSGEDKAVYFIHEAERGADIGASPEGPVVNRQIFVLNPRTTTFTDSHPEPTDYGDFDYSNTDLAENKWVIFDCLVLEIRYSY